MKNKKVLFVSSSGGHHKELMLIADDFEEIEIRFLVSGNITTLDSNYVTEIKLPDFNRNNIYRIVPCIIPIFRFLKSSKFDAVISSGAAPGLFVLFIAKMLRVKTIWIDSIANYRSLSLSGHIAKLFVHVILTQWEHLSSERVLYRGKVI